MIDHRAAAGVGFQRASIAHGNDGAADRRRPLRLMFFMRGGHWTNPKLVAQALSDLSRKLIMSRVFWSGGLADKSLAARICGSLYCKESWRKACASAAIVSSLPPCFSASLR